MRTEGFGLTILLLSVTVATCIIAAELASEPLNSNHFRPGRSIQYVGVANQSVVLEGPTCDAGGTVLWFDGPIGPKGFTFLFNLSSPYQASLTAVDNGGKFATYNVADCPSVTRIQVTGICDASSRSGGGKNNANYREMYFSVEGMNCETSVLSLVLQSSYFCDITFTKTRRQTLSRELTLSPDSISRSSSFSAPSLTVTLTDARTVGSATASKTFSHSDSASFAPTLLTWTATDLISSSKGSPRGSIVRQSSAILLPLGEIMCFRLYADDERNRRCFVRALKALVSQSTAGNGSAMISGYTHALWTFTTADVTQGTNVNAIGDVLQSAVRIEATDVEPSQVALRPYNAISTISLYNGTLVLQLGDAGLAYVINTSSGATLLTISDALLTCYGSATNDDIALFSARIVQVSQSAVAVECPGLAVHVLEVASTDGRLSYGIVSQADNVTAGSLHLAAETMSPYATSNMSLVYAVLTLGRPGDGAGGYVSFYQWLPGAPEPLTTGTTECLSAGCISFQPLTVRAILSGQDGRLNVTEFLYAEGGTLFLAHRGTLPNPPRSTVNINPRNPAAGIATSCRYDVANQIVVTASDMFLSVVDVSSSSGGDVSTALQQIEMWELADPIVALEDLPVPATPLVPEPCHLRLMIMTLESAAIVCINVTTARPLSRRYANISIAWTLSNDFTRSRNKTTQEVRRSQLRPAVGSSRAAEGYSAGSYASIVASSKVLVGYNALATSFSFSFFDQHAAGGGPDSSNGGDFFPPAVAIPCPFSYEGNPMAVAFVASPAGALLRDSSGASTIRLSQLAVLTFADQSIAVPPEWPAPSGSISHVERNSSSSWSTPPLLCAFCGLSEPGNIPQLCFFENNPTGDVAVKRSIDSVQCSAGDDSTVATTWLSSSSSTSSGNPLIAFACKKQLVLVLLTKTALDDFHLDVLSVVALPESVLGPAVGQSPIAYSVAIFSNGTIFASTDGLGAVVWMARLSPSGGVEPSSEATVAIAAAQTAVESLVPVNMSCVLARCGSNSGSIYIACNGTATAFLVASAAPPNLLPITGPTNGWVFSNSAVIGADGNAAVLLVQLQETSQNFLEWCVTNMSDFDPSQTRTPPATSSGFYCVPCWGTRLEQNSNITSFGGYVTPAPMPAAGQILFTLCVNSTVCFTEGVCVGSPWCARASLSPAPGGNSSGSLFFVHRLAAADLVCLTGSVVHALWGILLLTLPDCHLTAVDLHSSQDLWSTRNSSSSLSGFRAPPGQLPPQMTLIRGSALVTAPFVLANTSCSDCQKMITFDIRTGTLVADHGYFFDSTIDDDDNANATLFSLSTGVVLPQLLPSSSSSMSSSSGEDVAPYSGAIVIFSTDESRSSSRESATVAAVTIPILWLMNVAYNGGYDFYFGQFLDAPFVVAQASYDVIQAIAFGLPPLWRPWISANAWIPPILLVRGSSTETTPRYGNTSTFSIDLNLEAILAPSSLSGFVNGSALGCIAAKIPPDYASLVFINFGLNPLIGGVVDFSSLPSTVEVIRASGTSLVGSFDITALPASLQVLNLNGLVVAARLNDPLVLPKSMQVLRLSGAFVWLPSTLSPEFLHSLPSSLRILSLSDAALTGSLNLDFILAKNVSNWALEELTITGSSTVDGVLSNISAYQLPPQLKSINVSGNRLRGTLALHECPTPPPSSFRGSTSLLVTVDGSLNNITGSLHLSQICPSIGLLNVSGNKELGGAVDGFATSHEHPLVIDATGTSINEIIAPSCPLPPSNSSNISFIVDGGSAVVCVVESNDQISFLPLCDPSAQIALYPFHETVYVAPLNITISEATIGSVGQLSIFAFAASHFDRTQLAFEDTFLRELSASPFAQLIRGNEEDAFVVLSGATTENASIVITSKTDPRKVYFSFSVDSCVVNHYVLGNSTSYCMQDANNPQKNYVLNLTRNTTEMHVIDLSGLYPLEKDCVFEFPMLLQRNASTGGGGNSVGVSLFPAWFMLKSSNMSYCLPNQVQYITDLNAITSSANDSTAVPDTWNFESANSQATGLQIHVTAKECVVVHPIEQCRGLPVVPPVNDDETCYRDLCSPSETVVWTSCMGSGVHAGFARLGQCHPLSLYFGPSLQPIVTQGVTQQCPTDVSSCAVAPSESNITQPQCSLLAGRFSGLAGCLLTFGYDPSSVVNTNLAQYCNATKGGQKYQPCVGDVGEQASVCNVVDVFSAPASFENIRVRASCEHHGGSVILTDCLTGLPMFEFDTSACSGQYSFQCSPCLAYVDPLAHAQPLVFLFASSIKDILLILFGATVLSKPAIRRRTTKWLVNIYVSMLPYYKQEREDWTRKWFVRLNPKIVAESDFVWVYNALCQGKQLRRSTRSRKQKRRRRNEAAAAAAAGGLGGGGGADGGRRKKVSGMDVMRGYDVPLLFETDDDDSNAKSNNYLSTADVSAINDEVLSSHESDPFFAFYIEHLTENRSQIVIETTADLIEQFQSLRSAFTAHRDFMQQLSIEQRRLILQRGLGRGREDNSLSVTAHTTKDYDEDDDDEDEVDSTNGSNNSNNLRDARAVQESLVVKEMRLWLAVKKAKEAFLSIAGVECVILEKASLDNKFTPQAWMLSLQLLYAIIFLLICIVESGKVTYTAWTTYEAVYFRFINSSTSVGLLTNSILRRFYRFDGKHYLDFFVVASVVILFPPFVTHTIPGLILYFWLTLGVAVLIFAAVQTRKLLANQTWFHQQSYRSVAYRITVRFFLTAVLTFVLQMGFNYAVLFYKRETFQLSYFEVVSWEYQSRGLRCFLIDAFETLTNTLQLFSIAS